MTERPSWYTAAAPVAAMLFAVAGSALLRIEGETDWAGRVWMAGLVLTGVPVLVRTLRSVMRGHLATDVVATLAIVGALILGHPLAGLIVVLMQTGGEALERVAEGRASRAVRELEADAPHIAHLAVAGVVVRDVAADEVRPGNEILIRPGEMVPCDGVVTSGESQLDESRLTGEPLPVHARPGTPLMSGTLNLNGALTVRVTTLARESQYARIVELVRSATASKAPLQRLADRYAVWFTPVTLLVCAIAWSISGDAARALAVLVVATPCPLILATPIAIIGGINRAARRQIIMRTGGALERLSRVRAAVFDKTGTLTVGRPEVAHITAIPPHTERTLLHLVGSIEQHSGHALARSVVAAASASERLTTPTEASEDPGRGITGSVDGHMVSVGSRGYIAERATAMNNGSMNGTVERENVALLRAYTALDGRFSGTISFADRLRPGAQGMIDGLRRLGVRRTMLLSGDHADVVQATASSLGIEVAHGDLLPAEKVTRIADLTAEAGPVLMVGDGTNDAPALSRADVGVALAGHGGGVTAEAADVVILNDDLSRVTDAVAISRRTMRIARESIWVGLSLSMAAMIAAAAGHIPPVAGALLQEGIDVAVILNALRASAPPGETSTARRRPDE